MHYENHATLHWYLSAVEVLFGKYTCKQIFFERPNILILEYSCLSKGPKARSLARKAHRLLVCYNF